MNKRAEERALEALPPRWRKTKDGKGKIDSVLPVRKAYIRAYEQAEEDILDKAIGWLKIHADNYILNLTESFPDAPFKAKIGGKCWDDLIKAMEEE